MENQKMKAALKYRKMNLSVIPVFLGKEMKKPPIKWIQYQTEPADEAQIRAWWKKWPDANIAVITGKKSNCTVIDTDSPAGKAAVEEYLPDSIEMPVCNTPKGGQHLYFKFTPGIPNKARILTDTDIRTEGGYILAPPSSNGKGKYTWVDGLSIFDRKPPPMPSGLANILREAPPTLATTRSQSKKMQSYKSTNSSYIRGNVDAGQHRQQSSTKSTFFTRGQRDESLFHLANCLVKGGMQEDNLYEYLHFFASHCKPPFPEKEATIKIQSALKRGEKRSQNLTATIREYISSTIGNISSTDIIQASTKSTLPEDRRKISAILSRMVKEGFIERVGNQNGLFRRVVKDCESEDWQATETTSVNMWIPFHLDTMIDIPPGSIILVAGSQDAGKSALLMNIARENMDDWNVLYFSSELNAAAFKMRAKKFPDLSIDQWNIKFYQRSENFHDVIKTGPRDLNLIDYMEVHTEFYRVSEYLAKIHRKLGQGICVVALQKDPYALNGRGGSFTQEKPILSLALDYGRATITKFKGQFKGENPRGKEYRFKLVDGCRFIRVSGWHTPPPRE